MIGNRITAHDTDFAVIARARVAKPAIDIPASPGLAQVGFEVTAALEGLVDVAVDQAERRRWSANAWLIRKSGYHRPAFSARNMVRLGASRHSAKRLETRCGPRQPIRTSVTQRRRSA